MHDYRYFRPSTEIVVYPAHTLLEEPMRVRMTEWEANNLSWDQSYYCGYRPARYPVPVCIQDIAHTGYVRSGIGAMTGIPYIWVCSIRRAWTFWGNGIGLIEEWYDSSGVYRRLRHVVNKFHSPID